MEITGTHTEWKVDDTVQAMVDAKNIIIVPGYGLAVAKGQYPVAELVSILKNRNVETQKIDRNAVNIHLIYVKIPENYT